ncbi:MAG: C40 family peptidase [Bacteroidetes bacterium]|nr:C40 family peptidase [Bacteroidota bacterium]
MKALLAISLLVMNPAWLGAEEQYLTKVRTYELLVAEAMKHLGTKYRLGGCAPGGFDCSGFVSFLFGKFGVELPRISHEQAGEGKRVGLRKVKKGDLLFFRGSNIKDRTIGHVGIVVSDKGEPVRFIHASTSKGVVISELSTAYYKDRFRKARCFRELKRKVKI